jgi:hypothetical protein
MGIQINGQTDNISAVDGSLSVDGTVTQQTIRLSGSTSGYVDLTAPAVAGSNNLVLPTGNGTADQVLAGNGSGALSFVDRGRMVLETAKTATGTSVDFTGIPSWVKRITVMFSEVSTNGSSNYAIRLGDSGGFENTGHSSIATRIGSSGGVSQTSTTAFVLTDAALAVNTYNGNIMICNITGNSWTVSGVLAWDSVGNVNVLAGAKTLSDTLTQLRITTVNGTDTFDAGSINIMYEG